MLPGLFDEVIQGPEIGSLAFKHVIWTLTTYLGDHFLLLFPCSIILHDTEDRGKERKHGLVHDMVLRERLDLK